MDPRLTEGRNPRTRAIDRADSATIVHMIQAEDRAVPEAVASQADALARVIDEVVERFRRGGRLVYVGAGTSGRLGVLDAAECPPTFGVEPGLVEAIIAGGSGALVRSAEGAEDSRKGGAEAVRAFGVSPADLVLGITTSGTTPYVLGALAEAASRGAGTAFLGCTAPPAEVPELADHLILPLVGPEVIAGSTRMKAGTATKLVLNTITTGAMIRSGRVFENLMVDLRARSDKLVDRGLRIFVMLTGTSREEARRALIRTGGAVKTALAMHALRVDRALAERYLDCADGFLGLAVERFGGPERPCYGGYPAAPGWPDGAALLARLSATPARLAAARAAGAAAKRRASASPPAEPRGRRASTPRTWRISSGAPCGRESSGGSRPPTRRGRSRLSRTGRRTPLRPNAASRSRRRGSPRRGPSPWRPWPTVRRGSRRPSLVAPASAPRH